ncbi:MAG: PIN domain-containing protein [Acidobacteriota bacterium]
MTLLLDTHFLIWITTRSSRLGDFPWLEQHRPWGVSPISLLEVQYLSEVGRIELRNPAFTDAVLNDLRFAVDEVPLLPLVRSALSLKWTRDPFDRLLCAHSLARRTPLCTVDGKIREHHRLVPAELA